MVTEILIKYCLIFSMAVILGIQHEERRYKKLLILITAFIVSLLDVSSLAFLLITVIVLKAIWKNNHGKEEK